MHILHHAAAGPVFGLGMAEELARHGYKISPDTLYPLLHVLKTGEVCDAKRPDVANLFEGGGKISSRAFTGPPQIIGRPIQLMVGYTLLDENKGAPKKPTHIRFQRIQPR